jgi:hypothetical protein
MDPRPVVGLGLKRPAISKVPERPAVQLDVDPRRGPVRPDMG